MKTVKHATNVDRVNDIRLTFSFGQLLQLFVLFACGILQHLVLSPVAEAAA